MPPAAHTSPSDASRDRQKKPRHRHSPAQLAALNELFDRNEHPSLDLRVSLAERLGMETKTVNAWFQNKRASSKKRTVARAVPDSDLHPSTALANHPGSNVPIEDYFEDDHYPPIDYPHSSLQSSNPALGWSQLHGASPDHVQSLSDNDPSRRMRVRPTPDQTEELKAFFNIVAHPSAEQRQALADRIGMRYQSVTNWFQNQRSIAKKKKEDEDDGRTSSTFGASLPSSSGFPPARSHPSLPPISTENRRSVSPAYSYQEEYSRRSNPRRSTTPYSVSMTSRPKRSRPEPYQLAALNDLYHKNAHPSVEDRTALSVEIGMDLGKVTNWFRNIRQTRRRHARKAGSGDDDDYYPNGGDAYGSASRSGSPSVQSTSSSMNEDEARAGTFSGSEDEDEEAVTPRSQSPFIPAENTFSYSRPSLPRISLKTLSLAAVEPSLTEAENMLSNKGIKVEDALLLLTFHRQEVLI
ncbi:homeobox-domain-containing protein [Marasmius fiardii PR-910]|nr:homeobox-domain-containing protein [Marasmius fiardii PR-910]